MRQYEILCANDAGRAPRKYPDTHIHTYTHTRIHTVHTYFRNCQLDAVVVIIFMVVNHLMYADDIVLREPSGKGMQTIIDAVRSVIQY